MAHAKSKALVLLFVLFFMKVTGWTTQNDPSGQPSSDDATLKENINYACSMTRCEGLINKGGLCFLPDNLWNHASVAMNLYYQANGRNEWNCHFTGSGLIVTTDPSYENCRYA